MIPVFEFHAEKPGPVLLVFGAVHGNEKCGTQAIARAITEIAEGRLKLIKGSVLFVPVANPSAYEKDVRYTQENLNRVFRLTVKPASYEARLANILCPVIDRCDAFLDIHSISAEGEPFIYLDFPTARNRAFAKSLGAGTAISGWPQLYKKLGRKHRSFETTGYAASQGKDCVLIECGQHKSAKAPKVAYAAIVNALGHHGIIAGGARPKAFTEIRMSAGFFRGDRKDRLAKNWRHLDKVKKGAPLIFFKDGTVFKAPYDAFIIMPRAQARVGEDWLYLGRA